MKASSLTRTFGMLVGLLLTVSMSSVAQEVPLGPGDMLRITVYGQPDLTTEARISGDGSIRFPLLGRVELGGRAAPAAADLIEKRLEEGGFLRAAHVNVLVLEHHNNTLSIIGEVNAPSRVELTRPLSLTEALAMAGGIASEGSERVLLLRADEEGRQVREEFDLRDLLDRDADGRSVVMVRAGDTLYVPRAAQFYVYGAVQRPGVYRLDRPLNVMQALSVSGGFNPRASSRGLVLYRQQPDGGVRKLDVDLESPVSDGDVLFVRESLF